MEHQHAALIVRVVIFQPTLYWLLCHIFSEFRDAM
jgi:hypothetical protein